MRQKRRAKRVVKGMPDWSGITTYKGLKAFSAKHSTKMTPEQNVAMVERMRQVRYGYKSEKLDRVHTEIRQYSMEEFKVITEQEYEEEIKKYGPR